MDTVQQVLDSFKRRYPGCSVAAVQKEIFDRVYRRLMDQAEFRTTDISISALIAGTREYAVPESALKAYSGTWWGSGTSKFPLRLTTESALRDLHPGWDQVTATDRGTAGYFYIAARPNGNSAQFVVGFDRVPSEDTVSGYPYVVLHVEQQVVLGLTDTIPSTFLDGMGIMYRMCQFWAEEQDRGAVAGWKNLADEEERRQINHLHQFLPDVPDRTLPVYGALTTRII